MLSLDPYLIFNGDCSEAMHFYAEVLDGTVEREMAFRDGPGCEGMAAELLDQCMHISVRIGDRLLMASDSGGQPFQGRHGISISLSYATAEHAQRVFDALCVGGKVTMPMAATFWAERFGVLEDRYGTPWMISGVPLAV